MIRLVSLFYQGNLCILLAKKHFLNLHPEDTDTPVQTVSQGYENDLPEPITQTTNILNTSLSQLDCSPLKLLGIPGYHMVRENCDRIGERVAKLLDIQRTILDHFPDRCTSCHDVNDLVSGLKDKILHKTCNESLSY